MSEKPMLCRERLREEGKPYPRSGCSICRTGGLTGCPYRATRAQPPQPQREATEADHQAVQAILDCWFNRDKILSIVAAHRLSTLPAAASVEAGLAIPKMDPVYAERHPLLAPIIEKRAQAAGNFAPEFSGQRGQDFDRGLMCAFEAVNATLQRMTQAAKGKDQADG